MSEARYAVGIDLGTTHCVISYVDLELSEGETVSQQVVGIPEADQTLRVLCQREDPVGVLDVDHLVGRGVKEKQR